MLRCRWAVGQRVRRRCLSRGSGSRKLTAERERGARVRPPGPCPPAGPLRAAKLRGAAGSNVRVMRGAGEPGGASQLSGRGGWTPPWLAEPRAAPDSRSAPWHQLDPAIHAPAGREPEAGWYGNPQTPQVPLTNEAPLHPRAASLQEQARMLLPEGSRHREHPASLGISHPLPLSSVVSILHPWASVLQPCKCLASPGIHFCWLHTGEETRMGARIRGRGVRL